MASPSRTRLLDWFRAGGSFAAQAAGAISGAFAKSFAGRPGGASNAERIFSKLTGGWSGGAGMPGTWSSNRIEQVRHYNHWVYKAIDTVCTLATKEPPSVVRVASARDAMQHKQRVKAWQSGHGEYPGDRRFMTAAEKIKSMQAVRPHEHLEYVGDSHPLQERLRDPNGPDTGGDFIEEILLFLELTGNSYIWPVPYRGAPGVAELWVMPSHWVWPQHTGESGRIVDYYEVRPWGQGVSSAPMRFDADEFIHVRNKSPLSKVDGAARLQAAAEIVDSYESVQLARFFQTKNGCQVGPVIQLDASEDPDDDLVKRYMAKFLARFQGEHGFNLPLMLPAGAELIRPPGDYELAGIRSVDQLRDHVLGMWGLTKSVVGFMEDANRASFEAALAQCFYLVVNPRLSKIGTVLTEKLAPKFGSDLRIFWPDMTPADRATQLQEWGTLTKAAPYRGNELRQWMGLEPVDEGEEVVMPMGVGSAGAGADPFGGEPDGDLMERMRKIGDGSENEGGSEGAHKRLGFSRNGTH